MCNKFTSLFFFICLLILPTNSFAINHIPNSDDEQVEDHSANTMPPGHPGVVRPSQNHVQKPSTSNKPTPSHSPNNKPNYSSNSKPTYNRPAYSNHHPQSAPHNSIKPRPHITHSYYVPRTEVVYVESQPTYTYTSDKTYTILNDRTHGIFGFGLRILGNTVSDNYTTDGYTEKLGTSPGFGWYIKYRPIRWISLELTNDYIFTSNNFEDEFVKSPLYFGIQAHIFDYGDLDVYGVVAIGSTFIAFNHYGYYDDYYFSQWGGQFGLGASITFSIFELGIDIRYTIESTPNDHYCLHSYIKYDDNIVHGVTFALQLGFSI